MDLVLVGLILVTTSTCRIIWTFLVHWDLSATWLICKNVTAKHNPAYQSVSSQSSDGHLLTIPAAEQSNSLARSWKLVQYRHLIKCPCLTRTTLDISDRKPENISMTLSFHAVLDSQHICNLLCWYVPTLWLTLVVGYGLSQILIYMLRTKAVFGI